MEHDQIAELNTRLAAVQRTLARTHNTIIYGAAFSCVTGIMSALAVGHYLDWPDWAVGVGLIVYVGAINLFAAKTLEKDGLDHF